MAVGEKRLSERTQQTQMYQEAERKRIINSGHGFSINNFFKKVWGTDGQPTPRDSGLYF